MIKKKNLYNCDLIDLLLISKLMATTFLHHFSFTANIAFIFKKSGLLSIMAIIFLNVFLEFEIRFRNLIFLKHFSNKNGYSSFKKCLVFFNRNTLLFYKNEF